jgi:hypothetical protein
MNVGKTLFAQIMDSLHGQAFLASWQAMAATPECGV